MSNLSLKKKDKKMFKKCITKKTYWGIPVGKTIYVYVSGELLENAIGIYDENEKFIVYTWDEDMLNECVDFV